MLPCCSKNLNGIVDPIIIINARSGMLNCLPGEDIPDCIVAPPPQFSKVQIRIFQRKRLTDERNVVRIEKVIGNVRGDIWKSWVLGIPSNIDPPYRDLPVM
jgi:hypothetical protein